MTHTYDTYGRPIKTAETEVDAADTSGWEKSEGWDFNEAAHFPEPDKPSPQRADTDLFPVAQDPPKSPGRGIAGSHRRKGSMSRRKSGEHDLSLNQQKVEGAFKVRFGLRGHLDAVRSVIFSGGGTPGEPEICTAGDDGTIKRWIIPARYENQGGMHSSANDLDISSYFSHRGHTGAVTCLTSWSPSVNFSSGGRAHGDGWIFSGGQDGTVRAWNGVGLTRRRRWMVIPMPSGRSAYYLGQRERFSGPATPSVVLTVSSSRAEPQMGQ